MQTFYTPSHLLDRPVRVLLVGCGGTGSEVLDGLARMHFAMVALGHPGGLEITAVDGDTVSRSNIGRQRFSASDVGQNKAAVLVHRFNLFYGLSWKAVCGFLKPDDLDRVQFDLLITCVDRASTRVAIGEWARDRQYLESLWLDFGNGASRAQVILGHLSKPVRSKVLRLPNVFDLYPELKTVDDNAEPSCSLAEALHAQDLFVNRFVADAGLAMLWRLFRDGRLEYHGAYLDVSQVSSRPFRIDPETWAFMGYGKASASVRRKDTTARKHTSKRVAA
jgi:PRTRC genetic system ThiF family protein